MLCLSPRFAQMARMLTTNGLLTLWVVAALAAAHLALTGPTFKRGWWLLSALACGLGAAREADALATGCPVPLVLQAARTTAHSTPVSASAHRRLRRIGKATGRRYSAGAVAAWSPYLAS